MKKSEFSVSLAYGVAKDFHCNPHFLICAPPTIKTNPKYLNQLCLGPATKTGFFLLAAIATIFANSGIVSAVTDVAQSPGVIHNGNTNRFLRGDTTTDNASADVRDKANAEERTFTDPGIVKNLGLFQSWMKYGETRKSVYDLLDLKGVVWNGWRTRKFDKMRGNTEYQKFLNFELMKINEPEQYAKYKELVRKNKAIAKELAAKRAAAAAANAAA